MPKIIDLANNIVEWDDRTWNEWWGGLTEKEKIELAQGIKDAPRVGPSPGPQTMAYNSKADIVGYGGAAGAGKTGLLALKVLQQHTRSVVFRNDAKQLRAFTDDLVLFHGSSTGLNRSHGVFRFGDRAEHMVEIGGLGDPGSEKLWQGRAHDFIGIDEAAEMNKTKIMFVKNWLRTTLTGQHCQMLLTFNPPMSAEGRWIIDYFAPWIDPHHPLYGKVAPGELVWYYRDGKGVEQITDGPNEVEIEIAGSLRTVRPQSRTFIPGKVDDNPFLARTNYEDNLLSNEEPLRSRLMGDFFAGVSDDPFQVIPTAHVEEAMDRWTEDGRRKTMLSLGVDVARGGTCATVLAPQHEGFWWDNVLNVPGKQTPDGPTVAGLAIATSRDRALICIDADGVGSSPYDFLNTQGANVVGIRSGKQKDLPRLVATLDFANLRSLFWWFMRLLLDPAHGINPALPDSKKLKLELTGPIYKQIGMRVQVEPKEDTIERLGWSPDEGDAVIYSNYEWIYGFHSEVARLFSGRQQASEVKSIMHPRKTSKYGWMRRGGR